MRHRVQHRKLGRVTEHRLAMLRNQATALLRHEHLTTTVPRAKELRPFVERLISIAKRGIAGNGGGKGAAELQALNARRHVMQSLQDEDVVRKLFDTLAPRFESRPGGYTRLLRLGFRRGDAAEIAQVELVGSEFNPRAKAEAEAQEGQAEAPKKSKGVGGRLRAAADRLRGKKDDSASDEKTPKRISTKGAGGAKPRPKKQGPRGS
ncbi:MAG TPA: 50S ribosomal protein L17 [Vicinamibacterales bacterium]|nr:50S ribosomal protein L17 [Vicinamibacterales bacterium]